MTKLPNDKGNSIGKTCENFCAGMWKWRGVLRGALCNMEMAEGFLISDRGFRIGDRFGW
jgi:hypothetical protein